MHLKVIANDFCPEDCPFCDVQTCNYRVEVGFQRTYECSHKEMCKYVHNLPVPEKKGESE